jgi:PPM family protein phosphatase
MKNGLRLRAAGRSDVGSVRNENEDSGYLGPHLMLVADGMGGHAAGELASSTAVAIMAQLDKPMSSSDAELAFTAAINQIGSELANVIKLDPTRAGLGTTLSASYWDGKDLTIAHVGDSRVYLFRENQLTQLTKDDTFVQTLIDAGQISAQDALTHPQRSLLLQAVDGTSQPKPNFIKKELQLGDRILLASDGLTAVLSESEISKILSGTDLVGVVTKLIEDSNEKGSPDNVTVIVADVVEENRSTETAVVGAAAEPRNRFELPELEFPADSYPFDPKEYSVERQQAWIRVGLSTFIILLSIFLTFLSLSSWLSDRYYVGRVGDSVAVYQGVNRNLGPVSLSRPVSTSSLKMVSLSEGDQILVENGLSAVSLSEALFIIRRLDQRALCSRDPDFEFCTEALESVRPK